MHLDNAIGREAGMTIFTTLSAAAEMGVSVRHAALLRLRYLREEILALKGDIIYNEWIAKNACSKYRRNSAELLAYIHRQDLVPMEKEANALEGYLNSGHKKIETVTELPAYMIEKARNHDIADLIQNKPQGWEKSRMVFCPFHTNTKSPSASIKNNVLYCFGGCRPKKPGRKGWDPILLLMERDGMSFPAAVKALQ